MKSKIPFLILSALFVFLASGRAQISVNSDGGVKMGDMSNAGIINTPNPFSETTVIRYMLSNQAKKAAIQVCDLQGKTVYTQQLPNAEIGQVEISAGSLTPGLYTYSLLVDGKITDTKKMLVTE